MGGDINLQENNEIENNSHENVEIENNNPENIEIENNNLEQDDFEIITQNAEHFEKMHNAYLNDLKADLVKYNNDNKKRAADLKIEREDLFDKSRELGKKINGVLWPYDVDEFDENNNPIFPKEELDVDGEKINIVEDLIELGVFGRNEDNKLGFYGGYENNLRNYFKNNIVNGENDPRLKKILDSVKKQKEDALIEYNLIQPRIEAVNEESKKIPDILSDDEVDSIDSINKYRVEILKKDIEKYSDLVGKLYNMEYYATAIINIEIGNQLENANTQEEKDLVEKEWIDKVKLNDTLYEKIEKIDASLKKIQNEEKTKNIQKEIKNMVEDLNEFQSMLGEGFNQIKEIGKAYKEKFGLDKNMTDEETSNEFFKMTDDLDILTGKVYQLDEHISNMTDGHLFVPSTNQKQENSKDIIRVREVTGKESPEEIEKLKNEGYKLVKTPTDSDKKECEYVSYKNQPLFNHEPKSGDVVQPYLGNCYMVAGINSIVHQDPDRIHDMIVDNNDGTCTVKFYNAFNEPTYVTVEKTLPKTVYERGLEAPLWLEMITKAYAVSGLHNPVLTRAMVQNDIIGASYHDIEGGLPNLFLKTLLGPNFDGSSVDYHSYWTGMDYDKNKPYSESDLNTVKIIEDALKEGKYVSAGTKLTFMFAPTEVVVFDEEEAQLNNNDDESVKKVNKAEPHRKTKTDIKEKRNEQSGIYTTHAYTITGVERDLRTGKIYLDIINPHASGGVETGEDGKLHYINKKKAKGHMKLELKDYNKYFWSTYVYNVDATKDKKKNAIEGKEFARDYYDVITNINKKLSDTDNIFMKPFNSKAFGEFRDALKSAADELNSPFANKELIQTKMQTLFEKAKAYQDRCENVKDVDKNLDKLPFRDVQRYKMAKMIEEVKNIYNVNVSQGKHEPCDFRMISNKLNIPTNGYQSMKHVERVSSAIREFMDRNALKPEYLNQLYKSIKEVIKDSSVLDKNIGSKSDKNQLSYVRDNENTLIAAEFFVNNYDIVKNDLLKNVPNDKVNALTQKLALKREELHIKLEKFKLGSDEKTYQIEHPGLDYKTFTPKIKEQPAENQVQNQVQNQGIENQPQL